jgi:hypothetical protein
MDKDGNKKEPMKKAVADKKKKAPVKESSEELEEANYISDTFIQHLKIKYNNKTSLSNSEKREVQDLVKRMSNDDKKKLAAASIRYVSDAAKDYIKRYIPSNMVRPTEAITNWKGEEVDPQVGDIVRLYGGGHRPIKGVIVGPGNGRFEGSFAIKFKNLRGDIVVDSFYAKDEFEIIQKASTNEAKKTKPDFLDMDKDGNKKEPMKKAVADKKKTTEALKGGQKKLDVDKDGKLEKSDFEKLRASKGVKEAAKPDFLDMDKDGNKKEPMKKAVADKKKNPFAKK